MTRILLLFLLISCNHMILPKDGEDGANGINGIPGQDGRNFYSYEITANLQEIVGDNVMEEFLADSADYYELPENMEIMVDNIYPECQLQDLEVIVETNSQKFSYIFEAGENRYYMRLKLAPEIAVVKSKSLKVYYAQHPKVKCSEGVYELHSSLNFTSRAFQAINVDS